MKKLLGELRAPTGRGVDVPERLVSPDVVTELLGDDVAPAWELTETDLTAYTRDLDRQVPRSASDGSLPIR